MPAINISLNYLAQWEGGRGEGRGELAANPHPFLSLLTTFLYSSQHLPLSCKPRRRRQGDLGLLSVTHE